MGRAEPIGGSGMQQQRVEIVRPRARSALTLTADLTEAILSLPTIPREDWCELAASALSRIFPVPALVAIANADSQGRIIALRSFASACWPTRDVRNALGFVRPESRATAPGLAHAWRNGATGDIVFASAETTAITRATHVLLAVHDAPRALAPPHAPPEQDTLRDVLLVAIERLARRASRAFARVPEGVSVSPSECVVLDHLIEGLSIPDIARRIKRSPHTIHDHVKSLHRKLGAKRRGELIMRAVGWPSTPSNPDRCERPPRKDAKSTLSSIESAARDRIARTPSHTVAP